jgi:hypothetical protein
LAAEVGVLRAWCTAASACMWWRCARARPPAQAFEEVQASIALVLRQQPG